MMQPFGELFWIRRYWRWVEYHRGAAINVSAPSAWVPPSVEH